MNSLRSSNYIPFKLIKLIDEFKLIHFYAMNITVTIMLVFKIQKPNIYRTILCRHKTFRKYTKTSQTYYKLLQWFPKTLGPSKHDKSL